MIQTPPCLLKSVFHQTSTLCFRSSFTPSISSSKTAICNVLKTAESANISLSRYFHGIISTWTILASEKLREAGLNLLRSFGNVDCSYNLSPQDLCAKILLCNALIVRSGTKVTREVFEAVRANSRLFEELVST